MLMQYHVQVKDMHQLFFLYTDKGRRVREVEEDAERYGARVDDNTKDIYLQLIIAYKGQTGYPMDGREGLVGN